MDSLDLLGAKLVTSDQISTRTLANELQEISNKVEDIGRLRVRANPLSTLTVNKKTLGGTNMHDEFLYFTFNGVHSSKFGVFYTNSAGGFSYPLVPTFTQNFVRPMYQGVTYHLGTDMQSGIQDDSRQESYKSMIEKVFLTGST